MIDLLHALVRPDVLIITGVSAAIGLAAVLIHRLVQGESAGTVVGNTLEGLLYGALGAYAGASGGAVIAGVTHPAVIGLVCAVLGLLALVFQVMALVRGDGGFGWKLLGTLEAFLLVFGLAVVAVTCFWAVGRPPAGRGAAIDAVIIALAVAGGVGGILTALARGAHWAAGWVLVPLNASWGAVGNILGLTSHIASWNCYADHGKPQVDDGGNDISRRIYCSYDSGFQLKPGFSYTQGTVMNAADGIRTHETVHVLQHFVFGPIFPITYGLWAALWFVVGLIAGLVSNKTVGDSITAFSYYNNPWEVMAYQIQGERHPGGFPALDFIFSDVVGWILSLPWFGGAVAGFIVCMVV